MECDQALKHEKTNYNDIMSQTKEMTKPKVGEISWNELVTTNTKSAGNFYSKLFGWQATPYTPKGAPAGGPPYTLFKLDSDSMGEGGMMQTQHPEMPAQWIPYVVVDDVDGALAKGSQARRQDPYAGDVHRRSRPYRGHPGSAGRDDRAARMPGLSPDPSD